MKHSIAQFCGLTLLAAGCMCGGARADPTSTPAHGTAALKHRVVHYHRRHVVAKPVAPVASAAPAPAASPTSSPAPVPNEAVNAPIDNPAPETSVAPSVFQLHYPPQGEGYTTGSSSQAMDDREAAKATGVEVKVPLPQ